MYDLYEIVEVLYDIKMIGSTIMKAQLLRDHADLEGFKEVLKFIYDPYFTTGLKLKKLEAAGVNYAGSDMTPQQFMNYLKRNNTGTLQNADVANGFISSQETEGAQWLAEGIATKDLQIGVSLTTLNNVYGKGFIPKIGIMRGMLCPDELDGTYIATEKIDGNRRLVMVKETGIEIYTRSGKRDYGLVEIEEQAKYLPKGFVYDTECEAIGEFVDSIELRQASASILNSGGVKRGIKASVFDMLSLEDYYAGKSRLSAVGRKAMLACALGNYSSVDVLTEAGLIANSIARALEFKYIKEEETPNIRALPILGVVTTKEQALELAKPIWDRGGEGIMLVKTNSAYEVSPNPRKTLLKIKLVNEYKLKCAGVVEGDNKYTDMLGAIVVDYIKDGKVYEVKVGSGFTDYQRQLYWDKPELITNKLVEIESFGESRNQQGDYSLNCPIFKRIVGDTSE